MQTSDRQGELSRTFEISGGLCAFVIHGRSRGEADAQTLG